MLKSRGESRDVVENKGQEKLGCAKTRDVIENKRVTRLTRDVYEKNDLTSNRGSIVHRNAHKSAQMAQNCTLLRLSTLRSILAFRFFAGWKEQARGAEDADVGLELGGEQRGMSGKAAIDGVVGYGSPDLVQQRLADPGDASADHDRLGIEQREHACEPHAQVETGLVDNRLRDGVALPRGLLNQLGCDALRVAAGKRAQKAGHRMFLLEPDASAARDGRSGSERFNAAQRAAATAVGALIVDGDVSTFARDTVFAVIDFSIDHDARADAGADRHVENMAITFGRAEENFGEPGGVGVVLDFGRQSELFRDHLRQRHVSPAGKIRRVDEKAGARIDGAGSADANAGDVSPAGMVNELSNEAQDLTRACRKTFLRPRGQNQGLNEPPARRHQSACYFCSANINTNNDRSHNTSQLSTRRTRFEEARHFNSRLCGGRRFSFNAVDLIASVLMTLAGDIRTDKPLNSGPGSTLKKGCEVKQCRGLDGRPERTRTVDLYRVKVAL